MGKDNIISKACKIYNELKQGKGSNKASSDTSNKKKSGSGYLSKSTDDEGRKNSSSKIYKEKFDALSSYLEKYNEWIKRLDNARAEILGHSCFKAYQENEQLLSEYKTYSNVSRVYFGHEKIYDYLKKTEAFTVRIEPEHEEGRDVAIEGFNSNLLFVKIDYEKLKGIIEEPHACVKVDDEFFISSILGDIHLNTVKYRFVTARKSLDSFISGIKKSKGLKKFKDKIDEEFEKFVLVYLNHEAIMSDFESRIASMDEKLDEKCGAFRRHNEELSKKICYWKELYNAIIDTLTEELIDKYNFKQHPELLEKSAAELKTMYTDFVDTTNPLTEKYKK